MEYFHVGRPSLKIISHFWLVVGHWWCELKCMSFTNIIACSDDPPIENIKINYIHINTWAHISLAIIKIYIRARSMIFEGLAILSRSTGFNRPGETWRSVKIFKQRRKSCKRSFVDLPTLTYIIQQNIAASSNTIARNSI